MKLSALEPKHQSLLLCVALKMADIGHCAAPPRQHIEWVTRLQEEFFAQGGLELEKGLPISALMDCTKPGPCCGVNQVRQENEIMRSTLLGAHRLERFWHRWRSVCETTYPLFFC